MRLAVNVAVAVVLLALPGCSEEPPPPKPVAPAAPEPELPALGEIEPYAWEEVDDQTYLALKGPAEEPGALKWDFTEGKYYRYDFTQSISQSFIKSAGDVKQKTTTQEQNRGGFAFVATGGNRATSVITIKSVHVIANGKAVAAAALEKTKPTKFQCSVAEDGTADVKEASDQADARFFFDALLALQSGKREVEDGWVNTRRAGWFKVEGVKCLRLETEFELAPTTPSGKALVQGRTVAYFAVKERRFIRTSTSMSARLATKVQGLDGAWTTSRLSTETTQRLTFKDRR